MGNDENPQNPKKQISNGEEIVKHLAKVVDLSLISHWQPTYTTHEKILWHYVNFSKILSPFPIFCDGQF